MDKKLSWITWLFKFGNGEATFLSVADVMQYEFPEHGDVNSRTHITKCIE